jgi:erythromycin esterase
VRHVREMVRTIGLCALLGALSIPSAAVQELSYMPYDVPWQLTQYIAERALPFDTVEPESGFEDLSFLRGLVGDARVVALGEATHGTHEFFRMKHRMIEFLVKEMGFTTFAIESNPAGADRINQYIQTGEGDLEELRQYLCCWPWHTREMLDLIDWMRRHNEDPGGVPSVSFRGFDIECSPTVVEDIADYVISVDPENAETVIACYDVVGRLIDPATRYTRLDYPSLPKDERDGIRASLQAVVDWLVAHREEYELRTSRDAFEQALHQAELLLQLEEFAAYGIDEDFHARTATRDFFMARNVAWLLQQEGPGAKIVLWAHNLHVAEYGPLLSEPMGYFLRQSFGGDLVIFGFTFFDGTFNAATPAASSDAVGLYSLSEFQARLPSTDSFEYAFRSTEIPRFMLDLRSIESGLDSGDWVLGRHTCYGWYGAVHYGTVGQYAVRLSRAFDVIIHIQTTTASDLLPPIWDRPDTAGGES